MSKFGLKGKCTPILSTLEAYLTTSRDMKKTIDFPEKLENFASLVVHLLGPQISGSPQVGGMTKE